MFLGCFDIFPRQFINLEEMILGSEIDLSSKNNLLTGRVDTLNGRLEIKGQHFQEISSMLILWEYFFLFWGIVGPHQAVFKSHSWWPLESHI